LVEQHQRPIDLLITDVIMPGMNGWELARKLESVRPGLKVLYMSGYTERGVITAGTLDSAHRFLQKPFSMNVLGQQLKALLEEDGTRQKSMTAGL
jgi:DNA-binding NtrC family response regulator